ncbi:unnamed protein product [Paramecium sonneborni]|uniref:Uncharacterized protein n=1 Tax=Paramecium sonneborni TaxID=65129 RepID=A0A8S1QWN9_9CILI|nr:unnamed protein product [Paramecium sonneborni]
MPNNQQYQSPQSSQLPVQSYKYLEVVREEDAEDEKPTHIFSENLTESQTRMLTAYTTPMKNIKRNGGNSSSSGRSPFQELQKSSSNQKIITTLTPNKNSVLKIR